MFSSFIPLPIAQATRELEQPTYEWSRLEMLADRPGATALVVVVAIALVALVIGLYWREAKTVSGLRALLLAGLRLVAVAALAFFFLGIEKRMNREVVEPSRVVILSDTSLSMALPADESTSSTSRASQLAKLLDDSPLLEELADLHDVEVIAYDELPRSLARIAQKIEGATEIESESAAATGTDEAATAPEVVEEKTLADQIAPTGRQSQLGTALDATLKQYQNLPLAAVVVVGDGGQNAGPEPLVLIDRLRDAGVAVHTIGIGPMSMPLNIAVPEILAPQRAFPGDRMTITGVVQSQSLAGETLDVLLLRRDADTEDSTAELVDSLPLEVSSDEDLSTVRFETRIDDPGKFEFEIRIEPRDGERNTDDNARIASVEVIEQQTKVLLFSGAAGRDYRFLRNQLRRDQSFTVDVLLQTGSQGVSQDANEVLAEFPTSAEDLFEYDAIVAIDPNWAAIGNERLKLLERWVSKQSGGLVLIPGPVNTSSFGSDAMPRVLRDLYPVRLAEAWQPDSGPKNTREEPQRLEFTRAGLSTEFLWLGDTAEDSLDAWEQFDGIFGAHSAGEPKPGATLYAVAIDDVSAALEGIPYLTGHYFGAGQVFYIGSSETWRLRSADTEYFNTFWTKLLRHVSQGRLLQSSQRAKLLVGQDRYQVGETVDVRAVVNDAAMEPLAAQSLSVTLLLPDGDATSLALVNDGRGTGNFAGEYRVSSAGDYRLLLEIPDSNDRVEQEFKVAFPQLEARPVVQNSELLKELAEKSGGNYYNGIAAALAEGADIPALSDAIPSRQESRIVPGTIDLDFTKRISQILLGIVVLALASEWVVRRLNYLA